MHRQCAKFQLALLCLGQNKGQQPCHGAMSKHVASKRLFFQKNGPVWDCSTVVSEHQHSWFYFWFTHDFGRGLRRQFSTGFNCFNSNQIAIKEFLEAQGNQTGSEFLLSTATLQGHDTWWNQLAPLSCALTSGILCFQRLKSTSKHQHSTSNCFGTLRV